MTPGSPSFPSGVPRNRPLAEEIAERGTGVFQVPPGRYWVLAGAKGFSVSTQGPYDVRGERMNLTTRLEPLQRVTGRVTDESGRWRLVRIGSLQHRLALANGLGASLPSVAKVDLRAGSSETMEINKAPVS